MENIKYFPNPPDYNDVPRYAYEEFQRIKTDLDELNTTFITPSSITVNVGGTPVGDVTDVQTLHDGNVYNLPENTSGFNVDFIFDNVLSFTGLVSRIQYVGSTSHSVEMDFHDYDAVADDQYIEIPHDATHYQYRTIRFPEMPQYINTTNQVTVSIIHTTTPGNNNHDLYVDYIALIGRRNARF